MVRASRNRVEPALDRLLRAADEQELALLGSDVPLEARQLVAHDDQQAIALATTELRPARLGSLDQEHVVELTLRPVESRPVLLHRHALSVEPGDGSEGLERPSQGRRDRAQPAPIGRDDGENRRPYLRQIEPAARLELACELPRDRGGKGAVLLHQTSEVLGVDLEETAVADGAHRGGTRRAGQEPELAEGCADAQLAQHPTVGVDCLQPTREHDEELVGRLARVEEPVAGGNSPLDSRASRSCSRA